MTTEQIITSHDDLVTLVKDGYFFQFCVAFALNKGFRDAIKEKKEVKFSVGDYNVTFNPKDMCFEMVHQIYFARMINAYYQEAVFIGDSEDEVIADLLKELGKEKP